MLCEFGFSITRGNFGDWYRLWCSSSLVFMHAAVSMQIEVCCTERLRVIVFDKIAILVFLYGAILGLSKSHRLSSMLWSSSIGFTAVKNTDCLSLLRLLPSGINPLLIVECISLIFPTWQMYSVKSSCNSTLSCNAGSTRLPPECPWIARKYRKCLEELGFKWHRNHFFGPPPFARQDIQSSNDHCEVPSNFALNSSIISTNRSAPSSFWGTDWSCRSNRIMTFDNVKQSWRNLSGLMSIPFLSRTRKEMGDSCHRRLWSWLFFRNRFPCNSVLNVLKRNGFWRFGYVFVNSVHDTNPWSCSVSKQRFDEHFSTVTFLMKADPHIQDRTDFRVSENPPSHSGYFFASK